MKSRMTGSQMETCAAWLPKNSAPLAKCLLKIAGTSVQWLKYSKLNTLEIRVTSGSTIQLMLHPLRTLLFAGLLAVALPTAVFAVQWQKLTHTRRHDVALEMESVRLNSFGRLTVWLRFIPLGESQRREAAEEYGTSNYRMHLEYYEIDCGENSALLQLIDILGPGGRRLNRLKGGGQPDAIIPGSVLDSSAMLVCPEVEDTATDDEDTPETPAETAGAKAPADDTSQQATRQRIADALRRTESEPANNDVWIELGNSYYDADMPKQAIEAYDHALKLKPKDPDVLNDQGAMYRQSGDTTRALANFEKVLSIDPRNLESLYNMGFIYAFDIKRIDAALEVWQRYLELDHSSETAQQVESFIKRYKNTSNTH